MHLPPDHKTTRLCAHSIVGQILFYAFAKPVISRLAPEIKMTEKQIDLIADHITEFSLAYIHRPHPKRRSSRPNIDREKK
jgi:hypothetical protein